MRNRATATPQVALLLVILAACASAQEAAPGTTPETAPQPLGTVRVHLVELADRPPERLPAGARHTGGTFGCGDRLVAAEVEVETPAATPEERVAAAVGALLAWEPPEGNAAFASLHDALRRSDLEVAEVAPVALAAEEGLYRLRLRGRLRVAGTCDAPRIRQQIEATATQFPEVSGVEVYVGDEPLDKLLTARGAP